MRALGGKVRGRRSDGPGLSDQFKIVDCNDGAYFYRALSSGARGCCDEADHFVHIRCFDNREARKRDAGIAKRHICGTGCAIPCTHCRNRRLYRAHESSSFSQDLVLGEQKILLFFRQRVPVTFRTIGQTKIFHFSSSEIQNSERRYMFHWRTTP